MNKVPTSLQRGLVVYVVFLSGHSKLVPHLMRYVKGCISPVWPVGLCAAAPRSMNGGYSMG